MNGPELRVEGLSAGYGDIKVLSDLSFTARPGEVTVVLGANGAGKTTLLSAIAGLLKASSGSIELGGTPLGQLPAHKRVRSGVALVQEGKRVFHRRTVHENLFLGGVTLHRVRRAEALERSYDQFPILREKAKERVGALSGGQQQMLAIAQALMPDPKVVMLDEPSAGLAPVIVQQLLEEINRLKQQGRVVILVEQLVVEALKVANRVLVVDQGQVALDHAATEIDVEQIEEVYLGATFES
jgi:branched-chain amino acid transport system ATP-binding protein